MSNEKDIKWVSVKDELPKKSGQYWCYVKQTNDLGESHFQCNGLFDKQSKSWFGMFIGMEITHWMPLPASPEPEYWVSGDEWSRKLAEERLKNKSLEGILRERYKITKRYPPEYVYEGKDLIDYEHLYHSAQEEIEKLKTKNARLLSELSNFLGNA